MADLVGYLLIGLVLFWIGKTMLNGFREGSKPEKKMRTGQRAPREREAPGRSSNQPNEDAWEGSFWEARQNLGIAATLRLRYRDGEGRESSRDVEVRAFDPSTPSGLMIGHCRMREATRTFRLDRILDCTDLETGEVVRDTRAWLLERYKATPKGLADQVLVDCFDQLLVLLYVAKADGRMMTAEVGVIAQFCSQAMGDDAVTSEIVKKALRQLDEPTFKGFKSAFDRVNIKSAPMAAALLAAADGVVATQKSIHEDELQALQWMRERLGVKPVV